MMWIIIPSFNRYCNIIKLQILIEWPLAYAFLLHIILLHVVPFRFFIFFITCMTGWLGLENLTPLLLGWFNKFVGFDFRCLKLQFRMLDVFTSPWCNCSPSLIFRFLLQIFNQIGTSKNENKVSEQQIRIFILFMCKETQRRMYNFCHPRPRIENTALDPTHADELFSYARGISVIREIFWNAP